jgi:hypothetical protein
MGKNLGYFGSFHKLPKSFESWVASVWTAICGRGGGVGVGGGSGVSGGNMSAQLTKASPPPYHVSVLPSISFTASPRLYHAANYGPYQLCST